MPLQKSFPPNWRPMTLKENTILLRIRLPFIAGISEESIELFMSSLITVLTDGATLEVQRGIPTRDIKINTVDKIIEFMLTFHGVPTIDALFQLMSPAAKPGESMSLFLERMTYLSAQYHHPSIESSTKRLRAMLITQPWFSSLHDTDNNWNDLLRRATRIVNGLKEAGIEISAAFIQSINSSQNPQSNPLKPTNTTLCSHCGKRGHAIEHRRQKSVWRMVSNVVGFREACSFKFRGMFNPHTTSGRAFW